MMGRQGGDRTMVSSSIALLQERFRQLQKVREKREEKELLKLFSESERISPAATRYEPNINRLSFQPEVAQQPYRQTPQDSLSLGLNSYSRQSSDLRAMAIPTSTSLWPNNNVQATSSSSKHFDHSDVDTSLHL